MRAVLQRRQSAMACCLLCCFVGSVGAFGAVNVILDTDMHGDCDDAGSLAMLHTLTTAGEADILAVMVSTHSYYSVGCVDAINTYYGRPDIPIGAYKGSYYTNADGYPQVIATNFPNDIVNLDNVPDATVLYRQILAAQPDDSVTIVTVGFLTNLELLLQSTGDTHSGLDGQALVAAKVSRLVSMAGAFPSGGEYNLNNGGIGPTSKYVIDNWPTPIVFSGFEIGDSIATGADLINTPIGNPVREAYKIYLGGDGRDRSSWDQTAVLYAVRGLSNYWTSVSTGYCHVYDTGNNEWMATPDQDHEYLVGLMSDADLGTVIEGLMITDPDPGRPSAAFSIVVNGYVVDLDASASNDADGTIVSYAWNFGDGSTGTGVTVSHTFALDGAFGVSLTVTDNDGKTATVDQAVSVGSSEIVAHYAFDESAGTTAADSAGTKDGTLNNFPGDGSQWVTGSVGNGLEFDATDDRVAVAADAALGVESMTLMAWVYMPGSLPAGWRTILEYNRSGSNWYGLWKSANGPVFHFRWCNQGTDQGSADFTTTIAPDTWYHVAGTFDTASATATLYLNGSVDRTLSGCSVPAAAVSPLQIGANLVGGEVFGGTIDDVRIYGAALGAAEVLAIYSGDTDGDGVADVDEMATYGTNIHSDDTDLDGMKDGDEIAQGYDPTDDDEDLNGVPDGQDDWDDDTIDNATELASSTYPGDVPDPGIPPDPVDDDPPDDDSSDSGVSCASSAAHGSGAGIFLTMLLAASALTKRLSVTARIVVGRSGHG